MKSLTLVGIVLLVLGVAGLAFGRISYTTKEKVLDLGPIEATAEKHKSFAIPDIASGAAILGGIVLIVMGARKP